MELGAEISQRIRSAIKAKLVDLGAYADDELPDYIMVMVANKKNVSQMTADLNLFLGNNTERFTEWLNGLLSKLQAVTSENEKKERELKLNTAVASIELLEPEIQVIAETDICFEDEVIVIEKPKEVVKPMMKSPVKPPIQLASQISTVITSAEEVASTQPSRKRKLPTSTVGAIVKHDEDVSDEEYDPLNPAVGKVASVVRVTERKSSVPVNRQACKSLLLRAIKEAETSVENVKIVRPLPQQEPVTERRTITATPHAAASVLPAAQPLQLFSRSRREQMRRLAAGDKKADVEIVSPAQTADKVIEISDDNGLTLDDELETRLVQESLHGTNESDSGGGGTDDIENTASPKFVVTLDGVEDMDTLDLDLGEDDQEDDKPEERNVVRVQPVKPVMVRLEEEDGESGDENDQDVSLAKKAKSTERCRFYPNCKNGSECIYTHPTTPCTNFPNCRFGDKCMYVHPQCKFDATCTRHKCPYTHSSSRPILPPTPPVPIFMPVPMFAPPPPRPKLPKEKTCRFFPRCTNLNCTFVHPKPCRFGIGCSQKSSCPFSHPALPAKDKLRWVPTITKKAPL